MYAESVASLDLLCGELYGNKWKSRFVATNCMKIRAIQ